MDTTSTVAPMRGRRLPGVLWNGDAMLDSWDRIEAIERETGARLIATHELDYETSVPTPPDGWRVVFVKQDLPDGKTNQGRVQAYDGPIYIADAALYLMTKKPELGIKNPYELTQTQYDAALKLLRAQRALIGRYWHDAMVQVDDFKNEGVVASGSWPFQVNLMQADKQKIASTFPKEGVTGWAAGDRERRPSRSRVSISNELFDGIWTASGVFRMRSGRSIMPAAVRASLNRPWRPSSTIQA